MKEKLKGFLKKIKEKWLSFSKKLKIIILVSVGVLLTAAVVITILMNRSDGYIVLFPDMEADEATEVYSILKSEGVDVKLNSDGEIEVPQEQWDTLVYELAEKGYPQSTPSYGTFFDNLGITMTEFEKKQTLRFELQDRLQTTLKRIEGVKGAIVTISMPDSSDYVWKEDTEKATASVTLTLDTKYDFKPENVSAVKNLVAFSAQKMDPADVKVIDANTGKELVGVDESEQQSNQVDEEKRLYYQNIAKNQIEENAKKILASIYGEDGVTAVASVTLDYDKIKQEIKELQTNEDGLGVKEKEDVQYNVESGTVDDGGIVGEENNTDIPSYVNKDEEDLNSDNTTHYERSTEWAIGYILTQKEMAQGVLKDATVSVVVENSNVVLTDKEKDSLIELVKNATNIEADKISVFSKYVPTPEEETVPGSSSSLRGYVIKILPFLIGLIILIILVIVLVATIINKAAKRKLKQAEIENEAAIQNLQEEINQHKRSLEEAVKEHNDTKDATANEVRDFVMKNPEITAALIRSMIKEDN